MDLAPLISRVRDHYVAQFQAFVDNQMRGCARGAAEVKMKLGERRELFEGLYCVDFIKNDKQVEILELQPDTILKFAPISGSFGAAALLVHHLQWHDVEVSHDLASLPQDEIA